MTSASILWRGLILPGHEACRLYSLDSQWHLSGTAVFSYEDKPYRLDYHILCDAGWNTLSAKVTGWLGDNPLEIEVSRDTDHGWWVNGVEHPAVAGCVDLDLNFSPSTNLIPIRRLGLAIGETAEVQAAWLRFPTFQLQPLQQVYRRLDETTYRYESAGGSFVADLQVNPAGFVTNYPGAWQAEAWTQPRSPSR
jgi:hypothetical protein